MENMEKYVQVFTEVFGVEAQNAAGMRYQDSDGWDSIGHMNLISQIEDAFDIMFDTDDILAFDSFERGKEILKKYDVEI